MNTSLHAAGAVPRFELKHRVKLAREYAGLSQQELADIAGISRGGLAAVEQGQTTPRNSTISLVAFATGVSREWLETGNNPQSDPTDGEYLLETVGGRVRQARLDAGIDMPEFAALTGLAVERLRDIELNQYRPTTGALMSIGFVTGTSWEWLETGETPGGGEPTGGEVCAIRESNPEPTDLRLVA